MRENERDRRQLIAKRKKQFLALVLSAVFALLPTVEVMAEDPKSIRFKHDPADFGSFATFEDGWAPNGEELGEGGRIEWDLTMYWEYDPAEIRPSVYSGKTLRVYYQDVDSGEDIEYGKHIIRDWENVVSLGYDDKNIEDLDHWKYREYAFRDEMEDEGLHSYLDVYLLPVLKTTDLSVNVSSDGTGTAKAVNAKGEAVNRISRSDSITVTATPNEGYKFDHWEKTSGNITPDITGKTEKSVTFKANNIASPVAVKAVFAQQVATPTFTPGEGKYTGSQKVKLSCETEGATIHYTTDESTPTATSPTYKGPIIISKTTTIKAIVVKDGMVVSEVATAVYTIEEPPVEYFTVTFDPNAKDTSGKMDPQQIEKGTTEKLKANKYTREGFTFEGWNTKKDGSGTKYDDEASFKAEEDITLYAQWKEDKPVPPVTEEYTVTVTADPAKGGTAKASVNSGKAGTKVTLKAVSSAGYKFKKWKVVSGGIELTDATKAKTTFKIKNANVKVKAIFEKIYEAPQPEIEPKGKDKIVLAWFEVSDAKGYDIFMSRCNNHGGKEITPKLIKTIKNKNTTKWTVTGLKPNKSYKALIKAYTKDKNGKKKYISKSPLMHVYTAGGNKTYTNAKSVKIDKSDGKIKKGNRLTLNVKDTYKIKASVKKADKSRELMPDSHVKTLRYRSSDPGVASVSGKGKITAKKPGKCKIYVYAHNGVNKTIKLTVK